jgi:GNAT superfamily N-acetyltransferase
MNEVVQPPFIVRDARSRDVRAILACLDAAFCAYRNQYTAEAFAHTVPGPDAIRDRMAAMQLFVAVSMGEVIGTIGCEAKGREGLLRGMAVLPDWQGASVASALLRTAETALRMRGCQHVSLGTTEPLKRTIHFYRRHGFFPSGEVVDFFGMRLYRYTKPL